MLYEMHYNLSLRNLQAYLSASIFGLTRGKVQVDQREPLASKPKSSKNAGDSVVYFDSTGTVSTTGISFSSREEVISSSEVASTGESIAASSSEKFVSSPASESVNQPDLNAHVGAKSAADQVMGVGEFQTANTPTSASSTTIPLKRRKPWERKVPATLFSRAQLIRLRAHGSKQLADVVWLRYQLREGACSSC